MPVKLVCQKCGGDVVFSPPLSDELKTTMTVADFEGMDICGPCQKKHLDDLLERNPGLADELRASIARARDEAAGGGRLYTLAEMQARLSLAPEEELPADFTELTVSDPEPVPEGHETLR